MAFPDRLQLPLSFDPGKLVRDLDALSSVGWIAHFVKQNYQGAWDVVPLRGVAGATHPVQAIYSDPAATAFADTPMLAACAYFREVLAAFRCDVQAARLMRLTPGSTIKEHNDHDLAAEAGMARVHIPVTSNPQVEFELNRRRVVMAPGEAWYLRLADPHRVANRGAADRIHLVIDVPFNPTLDALMRQAMA